MQQRTTVGKWSHCVSQKLHGDRMPTITHTKYLIDSPSYTLPAPAGLFSMCNKNCWLENSPFIISAESQPSSFVVYHSS